MVSQIHFFSSIRFNFVRVNFVRIKDAPLNIRVIRLLIYQIDVLD